MKVSETNIDEFILDLDDAIVRESWPEVLDLWQRAGHDLDCMLKIHEVVGGLRLAHALKQIFPNEDL
mgnify:CR=1 FL=1|tara:strand:+ start:1915 stop:2115 length:201 start_codon:yes stop_codon:yes gene_type:complete